MRIYRVVFMLSMVAFLRFSGAAQWDQYFARWEGKDGSVVINMAWKEIAPVEDLRFLTVVNYYLTDCDDLGFPQPSEYALMDTLSNSIITLSVNRLRAYHVGTMTYDCTVKEFFYSSDTTGYRENIEELLKSFLIVSRYELDIREDKDWKVYLNFLYPDDYLIESMVNSKALRELLDEGLSLNKIYRLEHASRFSSELDRNKFRIRLLEQGFRIEDTSDGGDIYFPYGILYSRRDPLSLDKLSELTLKLSKITKELDGEYLGWALEVR